MTALEEINLFLRHIQRFVSFGDDDWDLVVPYLTEKKLNKNQLFAQEGKIAKDFAFVLEGNLRQFYVRDGEDKNNVFLFWDPPGEFVYQLRHWRAISIKQSVINKFPLIDL